MRRLYDVFFEGSFYGYCWASSRDEAVATVCGDDEVEDYRFTATCS